MNKKPADPRRTRQTIKNIRLFSMFAIILSGGILLYLVMNNVTVSKWLLLLLGIITLLSMPVFLFCTIQYLKTTGDIVEK